MVECKLSGSVEESQAWLRCLVLGHLPRGAHEVGSILPIWKTCRQMDVEFDSSHGGRYDLIQSEPFPVRETRLGV